MARIVTKGETVLSLSTTVRSCDMSGRLMMTCCVHSNEGRKGNLVNHFFPSSPRQECENGRTSGAGQSGSVNCSMSAAFLTRTATSWTISTFFPNRLCPRKRNGVQTLSASPRKESARGRTDDSTQMERTGYEPSPEPWGPAPPFFASLIVTRVAPCAGGVGVTARQPRPRECIGRRKRNLRWWT